MGGDFGLYSGRKVRPLLEKIAREKGKSYEEIKAIFIEKIAKPATIFHEACEQLGNDYAKTLEEEENGINRKQGNISL